MFDERDRIESMQRRMCHENDPVRRIHIGIDILHMKLKIAKEDNDKREYIEILGQIKRERKALVDIMTMKRAVDKM